MTRLLTNKDVTSWTKKMEVQHLRLEKTSETIKGYDGEELFFQALRKDSDTWICTFTNTRNVRFQE